MELRVTKIVKDITTKNKKTYVQVYFEVINDNGQCVQENSFFANGEKVNYWLEQKDFEVFDRKEDEIKRLEREIELLKSSVK